MLAVTLMLLSAFAGAEDAAPDTDDTGMEVVLVLGEQPGPALWKVTSGEHVMWILGEISPYPRKVKWRSKNFERLMGNSQELLLDFSGFWSADHTDTRRLATAELLPAGVTLKDVISPELHKRVESTARRFDARELEELRPFAATNRLVVSAMESMDMKAFSARFTAQQLARKRHLKTTRFAAPEQPFEERLKNWQHDDNAVCLQRLVGAIG